MILPEKIIKTGNMLPERIVEIARSYIGQEETPNNSGFKNTWFEKLMVSVGWKKGQPWCAYFGFLVWYDAFLDFDLVGAKLILKYANGGSLNTYQNFLKSKEFHVQPTPTAGALVIFREGNGTSGHEGIVTTFDSTGFNFISGNTSKAGSREGTSVLEKYRKLNLPFNAKGLNLVGFVNPIRIF